MFIASLHTLALNLHSISSSGNRAQANATVVGTCESMQSEQAGREEGKTATVCRLCDSKYFITVTNCIMIFSSPPEGQWLRPFCK